MDTDFTIPVLGFTGWSGAGKTTLLKKLIPMLKVRSLNCALIKHARHEFDIDQPGRQL